MPAPARAVRDPTPFAAVPACAHSKVSRVEEGSNRNKKSLDLTEQQMDRDREREK